MNSDEERRCRRCGRPLRDVYAMATSGSLAAVPRPASEPVIVAPPTAPPVRPAAPARQAMLFQDRPLSKVIPFDGVSEPAPPKARTVTRTSTRVQTRRPAEDEQPMLDFLQPAPSAPRRLSTTVEAVIECDAPVAAPMHRACAAAIDCSMVLISYGLFFTTFHLLGGSLSYTRTGIVTFAVIGLLIAMFYGFVWVFTGAPTPGMRALRLTLINFDGYPPDAGSRWLRFMGACLGYCAGGLGLLWALLDEESLAWHDHISKTFPTFYGPETSFVRKR